jgi:hypothetical protein
MGFCLHFGFAQRGCPILARFLRKGGIPQKCPSWDFAWTLILGGARQRCGNCMAPDAALAAEVNKD